MAGLLGLFLANCYAQHGGKAKLSQIPATGCKPGNVIRLGGVSSGEALAD